MKQTTIQLLILLIPSLLAAYLMLTTTIPWLFWLACAWLVFVIWWMRKRFKSKKADKID